MDDSKIQAIFVNKGDYDMDDDIDIKKATKAWKNFRKRCKEKQISVRTYKKRSDLWEISLNRKGHIEWFYVNWLEENVYHFQMVCDVNLLYHQLRHWCFELFKEIGEELGCPCTLVTLSFKDGASTPCGYSALKADHHFHFLSMLSNIDFTFYVNHTLNYVENKVAIIENVEKITSQLSTIDPTRSFKKGYSRGCYLVYHYYYEGRDGTFTIDYHNKILSDDNFGKTFQYPHELTTLFEEHTNWLDKKTRILNMYNPPKRHLYQFLKGVYDHEKKGDQVFDLLSTIMIPSSIEDVIARHPKLEMHQIFQDCMIANITGRWFSFSDGQVDMHDTFETAIQTCKDYALKIAKHFYQEQVEFIHEQVSSMLISNNQ